MAGFAREVARRIFASELRDSDLSFRENEEQYAPLYLITPTGARCNRVLVMGTLTEKDNLGDDVEYWRGRVADPTGSIFVYAGQYQPEAAQTLAATEPPAFVAVVGKPSVYETEDGKRLISVRAESVRRVDSDTRDRWVLETAARTLDRIEAFREFVEAGGADGFSSGSELLKKPSASREGVDIGKALLHYSPDLERYRVMVATAADFLEGGISGADAGPKAETAERVAPAAAADWEEVNDGEIGRLEDLGEERDFYEDEGPEGGEPIEEEEIFFAGREKASPRKRR
ncbi:hypothetical protein [Candidatus Methanocrinis natronophilus]|uniref:DNA-binding protein n=1 Tax=Candidatus Methanocrinis natronophilus TaxID=3033396 RepID=A0ABT5XAH7_9EURY|nr:hypothetical protein [Candidatus Methanocrinis natronophilus]MDF0591701.1 hypothetical protein [Candidatus Methanocrinis natronophilus]